VASLSPPTNEKGRTIVALIC